MIGVIVSSVSRVLCFSFLCRGYMLTVSKVARKSPSIACLLAVWYSFHRVRCRNSRKSWSVKSLWRWVRNVVMFASSHKTARFHCGGHSVNCEHVIHFSGMLPESVFKISSICFLVLVHIFSPSPQSTIRCSSVSLFPQILQLSVGVILILCSRTFVGIMSWITLYQAALLVSGTGDSWRFFHTTVHLAWGCNCVIRISRFPDASLVILCIVVYIRLLYVFFYSAWPCGATYADSMSYRRKYPKAVGILSRNGGFVLCSSSILLIVFRPAGADSAFCIGRVLDTSSVDLLTLRLLMSYIYIYIYMELLVKPEMLTSYIYSNRPSLSENVNSTPGILRVVVTGNFNVFRPNNLVY